MGLQMMWQTVEKQFRWSGVNVVLGSEGLCQVLLFLLDSCSWHTERVVPLIPLAIVQTLSDPSFTRILKSPG